MSTIPAGTVLPAKWRGGVRSPLLSQTPKPQGLRALEERCTHTRVQVHGSTHVGKHGADMHAEGTLKRHMHVCKYADLNADGGHARRGSARGLAGGTALPPSAPLSRSIRREPVPAGEPPENPQAGSALKLRLFNVVPAHLPHYPGFQRAISTRQSLSLLFPPEWVPTSGPCQKGEPTCTRTHNMKGTCCHRFPAAHRRPGTKTGPQGRCHPHTHTHSSPWGPEGQAFPAAHTDKPVPPPTPTQRAAAPLRPTGPAPSLGKAGWSHSSGSTASPLRMSSGPHTRGQRELPPG